MAYKSLLTISTSIEGTAIAIDAAGRLAVELDAHLDALSIGVDRSQLGYSHIGSGAVVLQVATERAEEEARDNDKALRDALTRQGPGLRFSIDSLVSQLGAVNEVAASRARYSDLVILPLPYSKTAGPEAEAVLEAALFDGQAPVLVLPPSGLKTASPRTIILAWNQSREALVAARRALPFLKAADRVIVTVIDPPARGPERADPGGQLSQMLARHGVKAEVSILARTMPRIADILARQCKDTDADLLVMGAYGHSRFREAILGGATRDMLEAAPIPVFMAH